MGKRFSSKAPILHPALVHSQENTSQVIGSGGHIHHNVFSPMQQLPMFPNRPDQMIYNVGMSNSNFQPQNAPLHEPTTLSFGIPTSEELSLRILGHSDKGPTEENSLRKAEIAEQRNNEVRSQVVSWDEVPRNTQIASCNEVPANSQIVSLDEVLANSQNISWDEILANIETVSRNEVHANQRNKGKGKLLESPSTGPPQMMQQVAPVATTDGVQANQCDKGKLPESPSTRIHSGTIKRITYIIPNQTVTVVPSSSPATQQNQREMVVNQKVDDPAKQGKKENEPVLPKRRGRPPKPRGQGGNNVSKITKKQKTGSSSAVSGNAETISTPQQQQMTHGNVSNVSNVQTRHPALVHNQENTSQVIGSGGNIQHNVFSPMQQLPMFPNRPDQMIYNVGMSNSNFQPQNAPLHEPTTLSFGIPTSEELSLRILGHSEKGPTEEKIVEQRNNDVRTQVVSWDEVPRNTQIASGNEVPANSQIGSLDEVLANSQNISWDEILANIEIVSRNEVHANQRNKGKGKLLESPSTTPPQMMQQVAPVATTDGVQANQCDNGKLPESPSTRIHSGTIQRITYIIPNQTVTVVPSSSPAIQQNQREMVVNQKVNDPAKQGKKENEPVLPKRRGRPL
ncbi:hypothetical protein KIW84_053968 [Lathyrus oleraceus]|uniref:Uncharacterized protein n=1 Tax=Pisum sativum TaxID=3888 RepID=A0A9D4WRT6_PEA|nr:hypothetical protein KIW84_053968 [Pisum sativum]